MIQLKKISINQLICLVVLNQVGVSVLSIPYKMSKISGYDSWMSIIIGGIIAQIGILVVYQLGKTYPDRTIQQYISSITGKSIGMIINLLFAAYCAESCLMVVVLYTDVINRWLLFETPWFVLIGLITLLTGYIASSTLRSISTITQSIVLMFLVCFVIIFISGFGNGDIRHFLPIGTHGIAPILKGAIPAFWAFAGYELLLYVFPYVKCKKKKDILVAMSVANGITTFFYLFIAFIVTYNFSEKQLNHIPEPMIFILRKFRWPIVQSLDILFITIWLSVSLVTAYIYLFLSARYLAFLGKKEIQKHSLLVWVIAILCFGAGILFTERQLIPKFSKYHNISTAIIIMGVPTMLLLISFVKERVASK
ncbi:MULTISPECIES: GerAB/ArcD/ProY family transporter [Bacillaceae]|uniref:GerAB/ArcD/ProY family transporter n=1 Tax=Bacillaceae TaxID=186817 RepID=UPI000BEDE7CC|nr:MULTISPECIES: GerAB/ArcD/ProY family transporter [unclassified Bacillus (in: firmicutes)]PEC50063.1 spore gernimation protein [Bacillus sp. AFS096315]PFM79264.1 spore gernimation protein [Bacillus sp. AFS077874]